MIRRSRHILSVTGFVLIAQWLLLIGIGMAADPPDFRHILRTYDGPIALVSSDPEAKALFMTHLAPALGLKDTLPAFASRANIPSPAGDANPKAALPDPEALAIRLTADLAAWRLATTLKHAADVGGSRELRTILNSAESQRRWLIEQQQFPFLSRAVRLASVLSSLPAMESAPSPAPPYDDYARYLDRVYPRLIGPDDSWVANAEQEGIDGIQRRLSSFWSQQDGAALTATTAEERDARVAQYVELRLRPVLAAQVIALTVRAEADIEHRARHAWHNLQAWPDTRKEAKDLARLCGTWQWTVHNHQNHQDHKMMMVFPPSDGGSPPRARPTKITVLGDGVYLRWDFQGGYQEDSLLFTGEGQRLEGSFVNSAGAWGSITGKRIAACGK